MTALFKVCDTRLQEILQNPGDDFKTSEWFLILFAICIRSLANGSLVEAETRLLEDLY